MSKTWRERCVEAKERGGFVQKDRSDMLNDATCMVGETAARFGLPYKMLSDLRPHSPDWRESIESRAMHAVRWLDDPDTAERYLDKIEDRALELKRSLPPAPEAA